MAGRPAGKVLSQIVRDFGGSVLARPTVLEGALMDVEPFETRLYPALIAASKSGLLTEIDRASRVDAVAAKQYALRLASLSGLDATISVEAVVAACDGLRKPNADALRSLLIRPVAKDVPIPAGPAEPARPRWLLPALGVTGVLAFIAGIVLANRGPSEPPPKPVATITQPAVVAPPPVAAPAVTPPITPAQPSKPQEGFVHHAASHPHVEHYEVRAARPRTPKSTPAPHDDPPLRNRVTPPDQ